MAVAPTLGATRLRLIEVLHDLGLYRQLLDAQRRERELAAERLEAQRLARAVEARRLARERQGRHLAKEHLAHKLERRRFVLLLVEEIAYRSMTEEQKAVERFEERVASWLTGEETGP